LQANDAEWCRRSALGLVVDDAVLHLDLAGIELALEIRRVVVGVPEAELDAG